mgnify:CR=1 FL=1
MQKVTAVTNWLGEKVTTVMNYVSSIKRALEDAGGAIYDATHTETGEFQI